MNRSTCRDCLALFVGEGERCAKCVAGEPLIPVEFYADRETDEILALFATLPADHRGHVTCYVHVGQHGAADAAHVRATMDPVDTFARAGCKRSERRAVAVRALLSELRSIGGTGYRVALSFYCAGCRAVRPHTNPTGELGYFGGTGYGEDRETGARKCYACCAAEERERMRATGRATLYLTGSPPLGERVTDWGGALSFPVMGGTNGRHNVARVRRDVTFIGPDGFVWVATRYGEWTEIAHCRRTRTPWIRRWDGRGFITGRPVRPYVAHVEGGARRVFLSSPDRMEPPPGTLGVVGPFRTRRAADVCASGTHPVGLSTVAQFERFARGGAQ